MLPQDSFEVINPKSLQPLIVTCEHAANTIPVSYYNLGLQETLLDTHIARDKGCRELTCSLASQLGCAAFLGQFSRLLIDLNRRPDEDELIVSESDKQIIPGNQNLSPAEKHKRLIEYYYPYHQAIDDKIFQLKQHGITPCLLSIHAFTPRLSGKDFRPWNAGILYLAEDSFNQKILKYLQSQSDLAIGINVPYDLRNYKTGSSVIHGVEKQLSNCLIEIRDDEFSNLQQGVNKWVNLLLQALL